MVLEFMAHETEPAVRRLQLCPSHRVRLNVAGKRGWVLSRCDKTSPRRAGGSAVVKDQPPPTPRRSARRDCSQREQFHLSVWPPLSFAPRVICPGAVPSLYLS